MKKEWTLNINHAFTLAEVLITLGIIGVVAAITLPSVMNNIQDAQYKTAYKKAYSTASQAFVQANADNQMIYSPGWSDGPSKVANFSTFKNYFKIAKDCTASNNSACWSSSGQQYYGAAPVNATLAFTTASGETWSLNSNASGSGGEYLLDTNGTSGPNKFGYDRFVLYPKNSPNSLPIGLSPIADCISTANSHGLLIIMFVLLLLLTNVILQAGYIIK